MQKTLNDKDMVFQLLFQKSADLKVFKELTTVETDIFIILTLYKIANDLLILILYGLVCMLEFPYCLSVILHVDAINLLTSFKHGFQVQEAGLRYFQESNQSWNFHISKSTPLGLQLII